MSSEDSTDQVPRLFEFDEFKSRINQRKHGIDFVEAQALWLDVGLVEAMARSDAEPRILVIGRLGDRHWSAVVTCRGDVIRLISVRRSRPREVAIYEGE
jgi:uncharacterized DUF497 family protein